MFLYQRDVHRPTSLCSALILMLSLFYSVVPLLLVNAVLLVDFYYYSIIPKLTSLAVTPETCATSS